MMTYLRKQTATALVVILFILSACSEKVTTGLTVPASIKKLGVKEKSLDKIDSLLASGLINNWAAGATALVAKDGKVIYNRAFGFRDRETKALLRTIDQFRIASMTKPITSVAAMILIEQGKLNLTDPVSKYIPEFANATVIKSFNTKDTSFTSEPAQAPITIQNLLTHTSGVGYGFADNRLAMLYTKSKIPDLAVPDSITIAQTMKKIGTLPLGVQPGTKFYYGLSTDVLGYVIEVVSKKSLNEFITAEILKPLGMDNTYFFLPADKTSRLTVMYAETKDGRLERIPLKQGSYNVNYPITGAKTYYSGGSGLVSTVEDYAKFMQMILNKGELGGKRVLSTESINIMTKNQIGDLTVGRGNKFGLGFEIATEKGLANGSKIGKLSWGGAFNTMFWIDPERKSVAVLMTQVYPAIHKQELYNKFETIVNGILDGK